MKRLGYLLLIGGFLAAAFATALDTQAVDWRLFLPAAVIGIAGVAAIKRSSRGAARADSMLAANRVELLESLERIVSEVNAISAANLSVNRLRGEIDNRLRDPLRRFAEARESLEHLFGLQAYADIMSDFAAGERYVNRAWSASADGYAGESGVSLSRASARFGAALQQLNEASRIAAPTGGPRL